MSKQSRRYLLVGGRDGDSFHRKPLGEFASEQEAVQFAESVQAARLIDWWIISETSCGSFVVVSEEVNRFEAPIARLPEAQLSDSSSGIPPSGWG